MPKVGAHVINQGVSSLHPAGSEEIAAGQQPSSLCEVAGGECQGVSIVIWDPQWLDSFFHENPPKKMNDIITIYICITGGIPMT